MNDDVFSLEKHQNKSLATFTLRMTGSNPRKAVYKVLRFSNH